MRNRLLFAAAAALLGLALAGLASAWWVKGHEAVAEAACAGLPDDAPAFFRAGAKRLAHYAGDPDRWKNRAAVQLAAAEAPNHYIDLENYHGKELPRDRWKALALLQELNEKPDRAGMLPYALMENYDRLSCAFYDHRQDPKDEAIQAKCLVYAGVLAHYTGDCAMPLHTTRDYDGRKDADGKVVQQGIHAKIDSYPEKFGLTPEEITRGLKAKQIDDVWDHVVQTIAESHKHVERCYELDRAGLFEKKSDEGRAFVLERCRAGAQFTMDLWYTAWLRSKDMKNPY
jgi:hypothetical protein